MRVLRSRTVALAIVTLGFLLGAGLDALADIVTSVQDGYWDQGSTWNVNRQPAWYDTVFVVNHTVTIRTGGTKGVMNLYVQPSGALLSQAPMAVDIDILAMSVLQVHGWVQGAAGINGAPQGGSGQDGRNVTLSSGYSLAVTGHVVGGAGGEGAADEPEPIGQLTTATGGRGGDGGDVTLSTSQSMSVTIEDAQVTGGLGGLGGAATAQGLAGGGSAVATGGAGGVGGDLKLQGSCSVHIPEGTDVMSGWGRSGRTGTATGGSGGGSAEATGGKGDFGGDLYVTCSGTIDVKTIGLGPGGWGGKGVATGGGGAEGVVGGAATANGGWGGWDGIASLNFSLQGVTLKGGSGGKAGDAEATGGSGWSDACTTDGTDGGPATAEAGAGGNGDWAGGGGGNAKATGGTGGSGRVPGGDENTKDSGTGGTASATSGAGGDQTDDYSLAEYGEAGSAGKTEAYGGSGGPGFRCCGDEDWRGGNGGDGAPATAEGRPGGNANANKGGNGGDATAIGGSGGRGADGGWPGDPVYGRGGSGASGSATPGAGGEGATGDGTPGSKTEENGDDGGDGGFCVFE
jgi:hypothetical protein